MLTSHAWWYFRVLNDVVLSILLGNNADLLLSIAFGAGLERSLKLMLVSEADLDRVKHLVEAIIDTDDLKVLVT